VLNPFFVQLMSYQCSSVNISKLTRSHCKQRRDTAGFSWWEACAHFFRGSIGWNAMIQKSLRRTVRSPVSRIQLIFSQKLHTCFSEYRTKLRHRVFRTQILEAINLKKCSVGGVSPWSTGNPHKSDHAARSIFQMSGYSLQMFITKVGYKHFTSVS